MSKFPLWFFVLVMGNNCWGQQKTVPQKIQAKMQWFENAKLGIFIHTGIYAVDGVDESWSFHNKKITYLTYMAQAERYSMQNYRPEVWADLIQECGAGYAVITAKHHDGIAMYDTKTGPLSAIQSTAAQRDIVAPFFEALRRRGIRCGAYFSLIDWSHPDYPQFLKDSARYLSSDSPERWSRFSRFNQAQINEINEKFTPDLWWFDGDWEHTAEEWNALQIRKNILQHNPKAILNGRLSGYGDYETPEQNFPVSRPPFAWWELCMTSNNNWGYQSDSNWKTPQEVISIFADVIAHGGNLLLNMGPQADGRIPEPQIHLLKSLGRWNQKHKEAIFGSQAGLPAGPFYGPSTLSRDSLTLYLFLQGNPTKPLMIKGLLSAIDSMEVLGSNCKVPYKVVGKISWSPVPGLVYFEIPAKCHDVEMTVLKIKLKEPLKLYRGQGGLY
ncbi:MAG TPA: alpha-L-fucosidase [Chitinophagaceae bacterium]|nr:alpha-L-fucosidase [Chitinophagaceae bacterium]